LLFIVALLLALMTQNHAHAEVPPSENKRCRVQNLTIPADDKYPDLLVFVSFSMPMETLKTLNQQAIQHGGKLVFRGLVNNSFKEMALKLRELSAEALIDPTLFEKYQITQVPAIVKGHHKIVGNISLTYALEQFEGEES